MQFPPDPVFVSERRRFRLHHTCEMCVYFDVRQQICSHGWPCRKHREAWYAQPKATIVFCKEFELR